MRVFFDGCIDCVDLKMEKMTKSDAKIEKRLHKDDTDLNDEFVRNRFEEGRFVVLGPDDVGWSGSNWLSLQVRDGGAVLLALTTSSVVALHTVQEVLATAGMSDVFGSDADFLLLDSVPDWLGDDHAQRPVGHVENAPSPTVVVLVRHASVDGSIGLDVDNVSDLVDLEQRGDRRHSILAKGPSEHVTRAAPISLGIRHFYEVGLVLIPRGENIKNQI